MSGRIRVTETLDIEDISPSSRSKAVRSDIQYDNGAGTVTTYRRSMKGHCQKAEQESQDIAIY